MESLRDPRVLGASVTVPHKVAVMSMLDDVSPAARRAGAVNTIVNRGGTLFGDNTDIYGFAVDGVRCSWRAHASGCHRPWRGRRRASGSPRVGGRGSRPRSSSPTATTNERRGSRRISHPAPVRADAA